MRLYRIRKHEGVFRLNLEHQSPLPPGPGQIAVRVGAVSLNYRDLLVLRGKYGGDPEGLVPVSDAAGEIIAIGEGVTRFKVGDRVASCFFQNWEDGPASAEAGKSALGGAIHGVLAEEILLSEEGAIPVPAHLSDAEAATLPCAGVTAWNGLFTRGKLHPGQTVLLLGTGGVSIFGLQFAVAAGAHVIVTSSSDEKLVRAKELGAAGLLNYRTHPEWDEEVLRLTQNRGVDQVLEVGGVGTLARSLDSLNYNGHIALIGVLTGIGGPGVNPFPLAMKNGTLSGIYVGSRKNFETMNTFIIRHRIHPVIDRVFPFDEAPEAYRYLESAAHFGKVVIEGVVS